LLWFILGAAAGLHTLVQRENLERAPAAAIVGAAA